MEKSVRVRFTTEGSDDVKRDMRDIKKDSDDLSKKRITPRIDLQGVRDTSDSLKGLRTDLSLFGKDFAKASVGLSDDDLVKKSLDELGVRMDKFANRRAEARVGLDGDDSARKKIIDLGLSLDKLGEKLAKPDVDVKGIREGMAEIMRLNAEMDKLAHKRSVVDIEVREHADHAPIATGGRGGGKAGFGGFLGGIFGGDDDSEKKSLFSTGLDIGHDIMDGLRAATPYLIAGLIAVIASITPAIVPAALGLGAAFGGGFIAYMTHPAFKAKLTKTFHNIMGDLGKDVTPMVKPLDEMFSQLGRFIKSESGPLRDMFKESIPFARMFFNIMESFAKELFPTLTQSMKTMRPELPILTKAFVELGQGLIGFIRDLGPGIHSSVQVFLGFMIAMKYSMEGLAVICVGIAKQFALAWTGIIDVVHSAKIAIALIGAWFAGPFVKFFVKLGADIHDIWNQVWNWCSVRLTSFAASAMVVLRGTRDLFVGIFHDLVSGVEGIWGNCWNWTHDRFSQFVGWCESAASSFWGALKGTYNDIKNGIHDIWQDCWNWVHDRFDNFVNWCESAASSFWSSLKNTFASILSGIKDVWSTLWNWVHDKFDNFVNWIEGAAVNLWHGMVHTFNNLKRDVTGAWHSLWTDIKNDAKQGLSWLSGAINTVGGWWNTIRSALHLTALPAFPKKGLQLATGGRVPGQGSGDTVPAMLTPGEAVIPSRIVGNHAAQLKQEGVPGFANGGFVGGHPGADGFLNFANGGNSGEGNSGMGSRSGGSFKGRGGTPPGELRGNNPNLHLGSWSGIFSSLRKGAVDVLTGPIQRGVDSAINKSLGTKGISGMFGQITESMVSGIFNSLAGAVSAKEDSGGGGGDIVTYARKFKKLPYVWGGNDQPGTRGTDCSGFAHMIYSHFGLAGGMPRTAATQYGWSHKVENPIIGGLIFEKGSDGSNAEGGAGHVGIVSGKHRYISEYDTATGWREGPFDPGAHSFGLPHGWSAKKFASKFGASGSGSVPGMQNTAAIGHYLEQHGLNKAATAGVMGNMWQESKGNPRSHGDGGGGLIGITGDPGGGLVSELGKVMGYIRRNGSVNDINRHSKSATGAATYFCDRYERPGIPALSNRVRAANEAFKMGYANGGWINEPIAGVGLRSGAGYTFGEQESEYVTPASKMRGGSGAGVVNNYYLLDDANPDASALRVIQKVRKWKVHHGGQATGIG